RFVFSSRGRHTRWPRDWSSDVCSSDLSPGTMVPGEEIETPLGKFKTLRFDGTATRFDDTNVQRSAHVWVSDDGRRLPLVAIGERSEERRVGKEWRSRWVQAHCSKIVML